MLKRTTGYLLIAALTLVSSGCEDPVGTPGIALLLQVEVISVPAPPQVGAMGAPAAAPGIESIEVDEVAIAVGGLELIRSEINGTVNFLLERPVVVPLRLSGNPTLALSTAVPEDEYGSIDVFVDKLDPGVAADDVLIATFPGLEGSSVLVRGRIIRDGVEELFTFTSPVSVRKNYTFSAPRRFSSTFRSAALYTLTIDMAGWFQTDLGEFLDPVDAADQDAIEANIAASMAVVRG